MNRRCFLRNATAGAIALQSFPYHLFANGTKKYATDRIKLGPKAVEVSRLAMGSGTDGVGGSSNQTRKLGLQVAIVAREYTPHGLAQAIAEAAVRR